MAKIAPALRESGEEQKLASALRESGSEIVSTLSRQLLSPEFAELVVSLSWTHHTVIFGAVDDPAERYFYMATAVRERRSIREVRRQLDSDLFTRYAKTSVMAAWLVARSQGAPLPRRLVYVVDRRAAVDQATEEAVRVRNWGDNLVASSGRKEG